MRGALAGAPSDYPGAVIQVCSRCATRWNVRDRQRQWCPRCHGALLPPQSSQQWLTPEMARRSASPRARTGATLPAGFRWIAVRPGTGPAPRRRRRPLGPTPRYAYIPRWGLLDPATQSGLEPVHPPRRGPSPRALRAILITTLIALAGAALLHVVRYVLLIINRDVLLNPIVATVANDVTIAASAAVMLSIVGFAYALTDWLIARRAAAFEHQGRPEPRSGWALWLGCLVPVVNLFWALTFVVELARTEGKHRELRRLIWSWWVFFVLSTVVSVYATVMSFLVDTTQGIADNTLTFVVAYLMAMAAVIAVSRVLFAFERRPVQRPSHRWLVVDDEKKPGSTAPAAVEPDGQEPAA